jgi:2'-5' RNA ligase
MAEARSLLADEPIRWVKVEILHLTLRFLGETAPATLDRVRLAAGERAAAWRTFDLEVQGLGCFPDSRRPRVIWAGAHDASGALAVIAEELERIARQGGLPSEQRPFSAHLTIGRVKEPLSAEGGRRLAELIRQSASEPFGTVPVRAIELLKSDLRPTGPVYSRLATLALSG